MGKDITVLLAVPRIQHRKDGASQVRKTKGDMYKEAERCCSDPPDDKHRRNFDPTGRFEHDGGGGARVFYEQVHIPVSKETSEISAAVSRCSRCAAGSR